MVFKNLTGIIALFVLYVGSANAILFTIDADNYTVGDVVTSTPGISIHRVDAMGGDDVVSTSTVTDPIIGQYFDSIAGSFNTLADTYDVISYYYYLTGQKTWYSFRGLMITLEDNISSLEISGFSANDDPWMIYFDKNNNYIGVSGSPGFTDAPQDECTVFNMEGLGGFCNDFTLIPDLSNNPNIHTIIAGIGDGSGYISRLEYNATPAVPIPAAVWLFGSGLIGLIGVARRKKA